MPTQTKNQIVRPPIVVIMGHIDHGKSSLLDYIRQANVVAGEAGGITQHIGAYEVIHKDKAGVEEKITFLDTPGHEAFSAMRARGANIADIAVLVVSAEEGVKPQTLEAHRAIIAARLPYVVAMTKIDRPNANLDRTKQNLGENGILIEGYGGDVPAAAVSSKTGEGVPELLDLILLVAELAELKGTPATPGEGFVLESSLDPKVGITATLVIKNGALRRSDLVVIDGQITKLKKLEDFLGRDLDQATFSSPIKASGFSALPAAGSAFRAFADKKSAEKFAAETTKPAKKPVNIEIGAETKPTELPVVIKADFLGTLEAVEKELAKLAIPELPIKIISRGVGPVTENDVKLASGSKQSIILAFHTKVEKNAVDLAQKFGLTIGDFDIIYKLSEWLAAEIERRRPRQMVEEILGRGRLLKLFSQKGDKQIVGGTVLSGLVKKGGQVKIMRREADLGRGKIIDLQQQNNKVSEVGEGKQFGAQIETKVALATSDILEAFELVAK